MDAPEPTFDIRDIAWEDDKLSQCAATIDSQRWSGITGDSRFWEPVQAAIAAGQEVAPYTPPPEPSPEEQRAAAYAAEADPIKAKAEDYQTEADAWRLDGNDAMAAEAQAKADAYLREYLEKKLAIRQRFPDAADVNQFTKPATNGST
ncbi:MAG: hypothetical protein LUG50_09910, partial [Planctomycetaceae bacterium]|nr:hypothetical protein [Planctomycetaceae bacterium]